MLSHRIIIPKPPAAPTPSVFTGYPAKAGFTQKDLDDLIETSKFVIGQYLTFHSGGYLQPNSSYANVMRVLGFQTDVQKLEWSFDSPKIYDIATFYRSGVSAPYRRFDDGKSLRALTSEEFTFVVNDDQLQNQIKPYL